MAIAIDDFLTKGYFAEELPPNFSSEDLSKVSKMVLMKIDELDPLLKQKPKLSKYAQFSTPRSNGYRRSLGIPNPLHFIRLSNTIVDNWDEIITHCNSSDISLSKLICEKGSDRSIFKPDFDQANNEKIIRATGYRYLLKLDITRCYHSIYTHSIPWAMHGKHKAKKFRKRDGLIGNALDKDIAKMQDGQTIGIPIGPDTSRVISEIILTSIDNEIKGRLKDFKGIRVIDDYHLYFKNLGDVEIAKAVLQQVLRSYELELNRNKEEVSLLPEIIEREWLNELREFRFKNDWKQQRKEIIAYFDKVLGLASRFSEDMVLTYAISKIRATVFSGKNWDILQSYLLNSLVIEPKILPYVAQIILSHGKNGYVLNKKIISVALEEMITFHLPLHNDFEVAWSLWILKSLDISLSKKIGGALSSSTNSVIILTALDMQSTGLIPAGLDTSIWLKLMNKDSLYSEHWLFVYEAYKKGWLKPAADYIETDPFFKILRDNDIEFYKTEEELDLSFVRINTLNWYPTETRKTEPAVNKREIDIFRLESIRPLQDNTVENDADDDLPF